MSAAMSLRSNSAAAQAEGRGVRLFLPHRCLAPTHRASARPYISGVSAIAPSQFDAARFVEDQKRRPEGARLSAARGQPRTTSASGMGRRSGRSAGARPQGFLPADHRVFRSAPPARASSAKATLRRTFSHSLCEKAGASSHALGVPRRWRPSTRGRVGWPNPRPIACSDRHRKGCQRERDRQRAWRHPGAWSQSMSRGRPSRRSARNNRRGGLRRSA